MKHLKNIADKTRSYSLISLFLAGVFIGYLIPSNSPLNNPEQEKGPVLKINPIKSVKKKITPEQAAAKTLPAETISIAPTTPPLEIFEISLKRGGNLNDLLTANGASKQDAYLIYKAINKHFNMRKLQIGQKFLLSVDENKIIQKIQMEKDFNHSVTVERLTDDTSHKFISTVEEVPTQTITRHAKGKIDGSLFLAAQKQGLPQNIIIELIRIFSFEVDFQREIRRGDAFEIFYERQITKDGLKVREGNILYAALTLRGKEISLYRFKPTDSKMTDYFHLNGQSSKRMLMKTPIKGARLSSYYGKRKHPVLGYSRMHKGLDFGAPTGTPIMAAGNGIIEKSRRWGSYGNYVRIRHNKTYKTAYAHLSRYGRGIKEGRRVKQGQIIGYVGATGRVTARHLHYEVLKNGVQINPLRLKIPTGRILGGKQKTLFTKVRVKIDNAIMESKRLASLTEDGTNITTTAPAFKSE